jgi:hypothetical protein
VTNRARAAGERRECLHAVAPRSVDGPTCARRTAVVVQRERGGSLP